MAKKKGPHYVNNKEFYVLLVENKKLTEAIISFSDDIVGNAKKLNLLNMRLRKTKNKLGKIFLRICKGFLSKPNFINYSWDRKDIMTSDACWFMSNYIDRYDVHRTNPFAYFTQICRNAFLQHINKYKKNAETFKSIGYIENIFSENNQATEDWG